MYKPPAAKMLRGAQLLRGVRVKNPPATVGSAAETGARGNRSDLLEICGLRHLPPSFSTLLAAACWSAGVHLHMAVIGMHGCPGPNGHHICMSRRTRRHADSRTARDSTAQQGAALMHGWHRPSRRPPKKTRRDERDDTACPLYRPPDACNAAGGRTPACHGPSLGITDYYEHKEHRLTSSCITRD